LLVKQTRHWLRPDALSDLNHSIWAVITAGDHGHLVLELFHILQATIFAQWKTLTHLWLAGLCSYLTGYADRLDRSLVILIIAVVYFRDVILIL